MKILHILYSGLGGHGNVFFSMVDADIERTNTYEAIFFGIEPIREEYIKMAGEKGITWHFVHKKPGLDLGSYRRIAKIIKSSAPQILFLHGGCYFFPAWYASLFSATKMKIVVRETVPNHLKTTVDWAGLVFSLLFAKKTVFLNQEYYDLIRKQLRIIFSEKRTAVIANGINLNLFKPAEKPATNHLRIGMQGRLSTTKDHDTLIRAFAAVNKEREINGEPHLELVLAGGGTQMEALRELADKLSVADKVEFLGMLKEEDLPAFINSLDIYVHATLGEMMSTAIMQVMACAKPVIASDVFGVSNMILEGQNGILVPVRDVEKLTAAILLFINKPEKREAYAKNAFNIAVNNYSSKIMFQKYQSVFEG